MLRIRIKLPKKQSCVYRNLDVLHDAIVKAWISAGAKPKLVKGIDPKPWNFAPIGWRRRDKSGVNTLVVSTPDDILAGYLKKFRPKDVIHTKASTLETVDFSQGEILVSPDPIAPGQTDLGVVMLSPLAIRIQPEKGSKPKWCRKVNEIDLNSAVNSRLSKLAKREVNLRIRPDRSFIRKNPRYDAMVQIKERPGRSKTFVIGMRLPLVLTGDENDLRLAWHSGIGEKTRAGFGCLGLAEKGREL